MCECKISPHNKTHFNPIYDLWPQNWLIYVHLLILTKNKTAVLCVDVYAMYTHNLKQKKNF